ncbi:MAG: hypothetical protein PHG94_10025 [Syntrophomonas sp.]|nr:hypothetical protein [Syntrophomonas sp.]
MTFSTLFYMRWKQGFNSLFIYSKKGWGLVLFELMGLVSIVYAIMQRYLYTEETSLILFLAFIILLGYSYLSAEKYLSGPENRFDLLTGVQANNIVWAVYGQVFLKNLSAVSLFPLILIAATKTISLWLILLIFLAVPVTAALVACLFNILINRYWKRIAAVFYLLFSLLWGGGTAAILGFLLAHHNLSFVTLDNRYTLFILLILTFVATAILFFSSTLSDLWKEAYLQNDSMNKNRLPFIRFRQFCRFFSNSFIVKEWFLLWRNSITKIRLVVWVVFIIICSFTALRSYLYDPTLFLIISLAIWLFCYGEMPATAWQNEGEQKSFYWLGGFKPSQLIAAKIAAFLPLTVFGILTAILLGWAIHLSFYVILQRAGLLFLLILSAIIISLAIACFGHNCSKPTINDPILEQVPLTISAIAAISIEFFFCCIVFLPLHWILLLSITIPMICLIVQGMWLSKVYYSV